MESFNLLPWRKVLRSKRQQKQKIIICLMGVIVFLMSYFLLFYPKRAKHLTLPPAHPRTSAKPAPKITVYGATSFLMTDETVSKTHTLETTPLNQLTWAGLMRQKNQTTVFLKNENGETIAAKTGDRIGRERASILVINETEVIVTHNHQMIKIPRSYHVSI